MLALTNTCTEPRERRCYRVTSHRYASKCSRSTLLSNSVLFQTDGNSSLPWTRRDNPGMQTNHLNCWNVVPDESRERQHSLISNHKANSPDCDDKKKRNKQQRSRAFTHWTQSHYYSTGLMFNKTQPGHLYTRKWAWPLNHTQSSTHLTCKHAQIFVLTIRNGTAYKSSRYCWATGDTEGR